MSAIVLSRIVTLIAIIGGGMVLAHLAFPFDHGVLGVVVFFVAMALIGYMRGLRDATVRGGFSRKARTIRASIVAAAAVVLAVAAYMVMHGHAPR